MHLRERDEQNGKVRSIWLTNLAKPLSRSVYLYFSLIRFPSLFKPSILFDQFNLYCLNRTLSGKRLIKCAPNPTCPCFMQTPTTTRTSSSTANSQQLTRDSTCNWCILATRDVVFRSPDGRQSLLEFKWRLESFDFGKLVAKLDWLSAIKGLQNAGLVAIWER